MQKKHTRTDDSYDEKKEPLKFTHNSANAKQLTQQTNCN